MTTQMTLDEYRYRKPVSDICARKHGGNANSVEANRRSAGTRKEQRNSVFRAICEAGQIGMTCKELSAAWGVGMNRISGRFSELKMLDLIREVERRDGCGVYILNIGNFNLNKLTNKSNEGKK